MIITSYEALCNLGNNIEAVYSNAIAGNTDCFDMLNDYLANETLRTGLIKATLPEIKNGSFNLRCNKLLKYNLGLLKNELEALLKKYKKDRIGVIVATTNSGVEEYEKTKNQKHSELGNPARFIRSELDLKSFHITVSTACSSGLKAFILARDLLNKGICDSAIIACVDSLAKVPVYGFNSLEVLSDKPCMPFSKNRSGMNIAEASAVFIVEKEAEKGIKVMGLGESSDIYHATTPDPDAKEAINAIKLALDDANIEADDIDYINAHGTGTIANDIMESNAIDTIFSNTPVSSTKPMTGHCLGAGAGIEVALCAKLIEKFDGRLYPHVFDGCYDNTLKKINLVEKNKKYEKCDIVMCNSFGFGGTNAIMILGRKDEQ